VQIKDQKKLQPRIEKRRAHDKTWWEAHSIARRCGTKSSALCGEFDRMLTERLLPIEHAMRDRSGFWVDLTALKVFAEHGRGAKTKRARSFIKGLVAKARAGKKIGDKAKTATRIKPVLQPATRGDVTQAVAAFHGKVKRLPEQEAPAKYGAGARSERKR